MPDGNSFDALRFRKVLGRFTTGVTVITTRDTAGNPVGITANSFNSVSLQPPLVLWSLAKTAQSLRAFEQADHWAVHILSADQEALSNRFAKSGADKFAGIDAESGRGGAPLLSGCTARLQCKNSLRYDGGDHVIFVGEVVAFDDQQTTPLVYQSGKYAVASHKLDISIDHPAAKRLDIGFDQDFLGYLLARAHFQFFGRMSELIGRRDLSDVHLYILFGLSVKETRSVEELNRLMKPARQEITPAALNLLCVRGLVEVTGTGSEAIFRLTREGHTVALECMAESKAIESTFLDKLGYWNAALFKDLLKQFIVETDNGIPHPWEGGDVHVDFEVVS